MDIQKRDKLFPAAKVFCNPKLLDVLQNSPFRPFKDSKTLVDLDLKHDPNEVLQRFEALPENLSREEYCAFLEWAFVPLEASLTLHVRSTKPQDYSPRPPFFMSTISKPHPKLSSFVEDIKRRWCSLSQSFCFEGNGSQSCILRSSIIPLPHTFFIPGGRFRECYYWDTLWIVKGLIASDMMQSAKDAVRNLLSLVEQIGFVPNANRLYYLNRSQPPTLTESVWIIYESLKSPSEKIAWLEEALPILDKEHETFHSIHSISQLHLETPECSQHLSIYTVKMDHARPESFKEDTKTVEETLGKEGEALSTEEVERKNRVLYQNLAAGAESGWDYSSRWFRNDSTDLKDIDVQNVIPCCLNSILYKAEVTMTNFHEVLAQHTQKAQGQSSEFLDNTKAQHHTSFSQLYKQRAEQRKKGIMKLAWDQNQGFWFDYDMETSSRRPTISCAGLMPAWAGCWEDEWKTEDAKRFVHFVAETSGLLQDGSLSCTTTRSREQWDFPNCWPPLVDLAVGAMQRIARTFPDSGASAVARTIALRFLRTTYKGWLRNQLLHEKYDSRSSEGAYGVGGEYISQVGFGWTNGTILWLLQTYGTDFNEELPL